MSVRIIQERLDGYQCQSQQEETFALKEITQELVLNALHNTGFFKHAAFQGGTSLRILYGLNRFSEDLDFALLKPDRNFNLNQYTSQVRDELSAYGYQVTLQPKASMSAVQNVFLKDDSLGRLLNVRYQRDDGSQRSLKIKLEVDRNPPLGARTKTHFLEFPIHYSVVAHDLPSLMAGKSHALLCRKYIKGRDWFDFLWYAARKKTPNLSLLSNALNQLGPWKGKQIQVDMNWYRTQLSNRIKKIDWNKAKTDVRRFLRPQDVKTLELWNQDFFLEQVKKLR